MRNVLAVVLLVPLMMCADYEDLVRTLGEKGALTAEEVEGLLPQQHLAPAGRWVEDLRVRGRVQVQFGAVEAQNDLDKGSYSTFEVRRAFLGLLGEFPGQVRSFVEFNVVPGAVSCTNAYLQWRAHPEAMLKVGFDKPLTSFEEVGSSSTLLTHERSLITNTVAAPTEQTGIMLDGQMGALLYGAGIFTGRDNRNADAEQEYLYNGMVGFEAGPWLGKGDTCRVQVHHLRGEEAEGDWPYDALSSAGLHIVHGHLDFLTEMYRADREGEETSGFYVMPAWMLTDKLQGLVRYERSESDNPAGLRAPSLYTRKTDLAPVQDGDVFAGDTHQALLLGLNYYISGHGNKLMFAIEFAELGHTAAGTLESTTFLAGWRTLF